MVLYAVLVWGAQHHAIVGALERPHLEQIQPYWGAGAAMNALVMVGLAGDTGMGMVFSGNPHPGLPQYGVLIFGVHWHILLPVPRFALKRHVITPVGLAANRALNIEHRFNDVIAHSGYALVTENLH